LQIFEAVVLTSFLFTGLLLALAQPITLVVLGPKWSAAAPIFAGFTLVALFTPVGAVSGWLLASQGRGRDFLRCSVIGSLVAVLSFFGGLPYGPVGVALAFAGSCVLVFLPVEYYIVGRSGPVSTQDLWMGLLKHLPVWCVVCGSTLAVRAFWADSSPLRQLLVSAPIGIGAGVASIWLLPPCRRVALGVFAILRDYKVARAA
jgi:PST family polysaccharide transporter